MKASSAALFCLVFFGILRPAFAGTVAGELRKWHKVTVAFDGPATAESSTPNPFTDYRLNVVFTKGSKTITVPGHYAADGNAAQTGAAAGNKWRVHFTPDEEGLWTYRASFRTGASIAVDPSPTAGQAAAFDGDTGAFTVQATDKTGRDFRGKGLLQYVGLHHLRFAHTGEHYLKGGADSPENFLAFADFDQTTAKHRYTPHVADWKTGDPSWQSGKGKGIVGALNYLSGKGMNSVYFLTMNVTGDGNDVWPWTSSAERARFDVSKLDQWEIVFEHMDRLGIQLHVVTQETENDQLLDGGALGPQRRLYYRELISRFAHHPAVMWNLGEETTNTDAERKDYSTFFHTEDPYDHPVAVHTYPGDQETRYTPLLGYPDFDGASLQLDMTQVHSETIKWRSRSAAASHKWVVNLDEIGTADAGVVPDANDFAHDTVRKQALWGNLMAGGGGVEWYFGYAFPHTDLNCEDWRSRDHMWDLTRYALDFFQNHLPFSEMNPADALTSVTGDYCLAKPGQVYAVYLPNGGTTQLNLAGAAGTFTVLWYNPRTGGGLVNGSVTMVTGGGQASLGNPPTEAGLDWAVLVRSSAGPGDSASPSAPKNLRRRP